VYFKRRVRARSLREGCTYYTKTNAALAASAPRSGFRKVVIVSAERKRSMLNELLKTFFDNIWVIMIFLFIFGGSITGIVRSMFEHRLKMQEKKNEELRLRLELERMRKGPGGAGMPQPKESAWDEQPLADYDGGYQGQGLDRSTKEREQPPVEPYVSEGQELPPQVQG
jgi:hypothetical protein